MTLICRAKNKAIFAFFLAWVSLLNIANAQSTGYQLDKQAYQLGDVIQVVFQADQVASFDWFGIYPRGATPSGSPPSLDWKYVNNSRSANSAQANGLVTFDTKGLPAGQYSLWLLANDGYQAKGPHLDFTLTEIQSQASISLASSLIKTNEALSISFVNPAPSRLDWLGVYPKGVTPQRGSSAWTYLNGQQSGASAVDSGMVSLAHALAPGEYSLWLLANDGYGVKVGPLDFTVISEQTSTWLLPEITAYPASVEQAYTFKMSAFLRHAQPDTQFELVNAPRWLTLSPEGVLQGLPGTNDLGEYRFSILANHPKMTAALSTDVRLTVLSEQELAEKPLSVMTYNVWHQFNQLRDGYQKGLDSILLSNADVIGMQEASFSLAAQLAKDLGWHHAISAQAGIQTISRFPVAESFTLDFSQISAIQIPQHSEPVWLINTHLDYRYYGPYAAEWSGATEQTVLQEEARSNRAAQINSLLSKLSQRFGEASGETMILVGDFNVPSHLDWTTQTASLRNGVGSVGWPTSLAVEGYGFIDTFRQVHPDPVSVPGHTWSPIFQSPEPQDRIDRVYLKGNALQVVDSQVFVLAVENTLGRWGSNTSSILNNTWPSDHAAVLTVFRVANKSPANSIVDIHQVVEGSNISESVRSAVNHRLYLLDLIHAQQHSELAHWYWKELADWTMALPNHLIDRDTQKAIADEAKRQLN